MRDVLEVTPVSIKRMSTILSAFSIQIDFLEVLEEYVHSFEVAQKNRSQTDSERNRFDIKYDEALRRCENFREVFSLVRRSVKEYMNQERADMVLQLVDLPLEIGAAHPVGTNKIVMNQALLNLAVRHGNLLEVQAFVFSILLHEYIHSLGYLNEYETRELVFLVSSNAFGPNHIATNVAKYGPWYIFRRKSIMQAYSD